MFGAGPGSSGGELFVGKWPSNDLRMDPEIPTHGPHHRGPDSRSRVPEYPPAKGLIGRLISTRLPRCSPRGGPDGMRYEIVGIDFVKCV